MTIIKECSYSPNHVASTPTPLAAGKIHLLQKGAANDISGRVGKIVQDHLGYTGTATYNIKLTKTRIEFSIDGESRVLEQKNGQWELSKNTDPATQLPVALQSAVTECVTEVLVNIRNAANGSSSPAPTEAASVSALSSIPTTAAPVNLDAIHTRLDALNNRIDHILLNQPKSNPAIEALRDACKILSEEIQALRQILSIEPRLKQSDAALEQATKNIREKEQALADKTEQLERQKQALWKLESELADVQKNLKAAQQDSSDQIASLHKKGLSQQESIEQLESAIRELQSKSKSEIAALEAQLQLGAKNAEELNKQLSEITQKLAEANEKEAAVRQKLEALRKDQLQQKTSELAQQRRVLEALQTQLADTQKTSRAQIESLQKEAQTAAASEIAGLKEKISSLQQKLDLDQAAINKAALETQQVKKELRKLEADKAAVEENFKQVTQRLQDQFVKEKEHSLQQLQASEKANQDRSLEIEELKRVIEGLKTSLQQYGVKLRKQADEAGQKPAEAARSVQALFSNLNISTK